MLYEVITAYLHPMVDSEMKNIVTQFIQYVPGSEEAVAMQLVKALINDTEEMPKKVSTVLDEAQSEMLSRQSSITVESIEQLP